VTPGNIHDGRAGGAALPDNPGEVYADSAYRGEVFGAALRAKGGSPRLVATGMWGRPGDDTLHKLRRWNSAIPVMVAWRLSGGAHCRCRARRRR
jgi:IS5 family transposase